MTVRLCDTPWAALDTAPACARGERHVTVVTPEDDHALTSPTFELRPITPSTPAFLLVTLALEDSAEARADRTLMGLTGEMGLGLGLTATAVDGMPVVPGGSSLPRTGGNLAALLGVLALAAGALGSGAALRLGRGRGTS